MAWPSQVVSEQGFLFFLFFSYLRAEILDWDEIFSLRILEQSTMSRLLGKQSTWSRLLETINLAKAIGTINLAMDIEAINLANNLH